MVISIFERNLKMKKYETPDFDVTIYEINGDITLNISNSDPDGNEDDWLG